MNNQESVERLKQGIATLLNDLHEISSSREAVEAGHTCGLPLTHEVLGKKVQIAALQWLMKTILESGMAEEIAQLKQEVADQAEQIQKMHENGLGESWLDRVDQKNLRIAALEEALTPSGDTKAAYSGEFTMHYLDDSENNQDLMIPWTVIKDIMKTILKRADKGAD